MKRPDWHLAIIGLKEKKRGKLYPADVFSAARDPKSPLHSKFEWSKEKCFRRHNLWIARTLIEQVEVEFVADDTVTRKAPAFISFKEDRKKGGGYHSTIEVLSNKQLRARRLKQAIAELDYWCTQYRDMKELNVIFKARKEIR